MKTKEQLCICMLGADVILGTEFQEDNSVELSNESLKAEWC